jgi:hypothetical protein
MKILIQKKPSNHRKSPYCFIYQQIYNTDSRNYIINGILIHKKIYVIIILFYCVTLLYYMNYLLKILIHQITSDICT